MGITRRNLAVTLILGGIVAAVIVLALSRGPSAERLTDAATPPWALLADTGAFKRPEFPHEFRFPADHGPHPRFRTEWWSLSGSLTDDQNRRLGIQLTMVRVGLLAEPPDRASEWAPADVYGGVFSVSEPEQGRLRTAVRISRDAVGLAGARDKPRKVWVEDWRLEQTDAAALTLTAGSRSGAVALVLDLHGQKRLVDENELLDPDTAQAWPFHFYLEPRMRAEGSLRTGETETAVRGAVSMEHAWGELPLPGGPVAVDRFTLHLNDGRELLLSRTHRADGSGNPTTTGLLIRSDGRPQLLSSADVQLSPTDYWTNGETSARYPVRWTLRIPAHALELVLSPYYEDQAGVAWLPFWAGPLRIDTQSEDAAPVGNGLARLTGYERNE